MEDQSGSDWRDIYNSNHSLAFFRSSPADLLVDRRATKPSHSKGLNSNAVWVDARQNDTLDLHLEHLECSH